MVAAVTVIGGQRIRSRATDQYVNATELCKAAGKEWSGYSRSQATDEFLTELEAVLQICRTDLVQTRQGGKSGEQGTWIHPRVAINFAQWVSPQFAVAVTGWVLDLLAGKSTAPAPNTVAVPLEQFRDLTDTVRMIRQELEEMRARPAAIAPALPRFTVRERLEWRGLAFAKRDRNNVQRIAARLVERFCSEPVMQEGGTGGGGPTYFTGPQLAYLDQAIDLTRECLDRKRREDELKRPTLFKADSNAA